MSNTIGFTCWEKDEPIEIQLEPEAIIFKILPGEELKFVARNIGEDFDWFLRIDHNSQGIQLFPNFLGYEGYVDIYKNDILIEM